MIDNGRPTSLQHLLAAVRRDRAGARDLNALGVILAEFGEDHRGAVCLRAVVALRPNGAGILHHLANALLGCGDVEEVETGTVITAVPFGEGASLSATRANDVRHGVRVFARMLRQCEIEARSRG